MTLIERAEAARTAGEALLVFTDYEDDLSIRANSLFKVWMLRAREAQTAPLMLGYLLLAAMAAVPEGRTFWHLSRYSAPGEAECNFTTYSDDGSEPFSVTGDANFPCTALLSAIIKAGSDQ